MLSGKKGVPGASEEAGFLELPTSSNLGLVEGTQVLVPGRKRLMREASDSECDSEEEEVSVSPISEETGKVIKGRRRLLRRDLDSDSEDEIGKDSGPRLSKKQLRFVVCSEAVLRSQDEIRDRRDDGVPGKGKTASNDSEDDVIYLRTERAELSQSLLTSWLVYKRSRRGM